MQSNLPSLVDILLQIPVDNSFPRHENLKHNTWIHSESWGIAILHDFHGFMALSVLARIPNLLHGVKGPFVCVVAQWANLCDPMDYIAHQCPLSIEFSRQEYWSGLPFPRPGNLSHPGIKPESPAFPALASRLFTTEPPGTPKWRWFYLLVV